MKTMMAVYLERKDTVTVRKNSRARKLIPAAQVAMNDAELVLYEGVVVKNRLGTIETPLQCLLGRGHK